MIPAESWSGV